MNIVVMCALHSGLSAINFALANGVKITKVIGLSNIDQRDGSAISGLVDIEEFCSAHKLNFDYVDDYSLKSECPSILGDNVDILWVCAWQRLLPPAFVDFPKIATIGVHGSCDGIISGRGRSPQNWALLIGAHQFKLSIFVMTPRIDDGQVILTREFPLSEMDTIRSSYLKCAHFTAEMISKVNLDPSLIYSAEAQEGNAAYFPRRVPADGAIDWSMSNVDICNLIRALERPYPNAYSMLDGAKISINRATKISIPHQFKNGEVVQVIDDRAFLIACGHGLILVDDFYIHDAYVKLKAGVVFGSESFERVSWGIIERFRAEFPGREINPSLLRFWNDRGLVV